MTPFDFSKYYKEMQARCQVRVDLSGIELKTGGDLPTTDGSNPLTEVVTNNVNYLIWKITNASGDIINDPVRAYYTETIASDGSLTGSFSPSGNGTEYCVHVFDNLGEIETLPGVAKAPSDTSDTPITTVPFGDYTLHVIPRHTVLDASGDPYTDANNMNRVLGAFGFTRCKKTPSWYNNSKQGGSTGAKCVIGEDAMNRRIRALEQACRPDGTELYARWYDTNYADPENDDNTDWDRIDHDGPGTYGVGTAYTGKTVGELYPAASGEWISALKSAGYMSDMSASGDGMNPFQLSISEAFKTEYASADELQGDFMDAVDAIIDAASDAPYIKAGKYTSALKKDVYSSAGYVTGPTAGDSNLWLIDFDAMFGITPAFTYGTVGYAKSYRMMPAAVSKYWGWYAVPTKDWYDNTDYGGIMWRRMVVRSYGDGTVSALDPDGNAAGYVVGRKVTSEGVKDFDDLAGRVHEACGKIFDPSTDTENYTNYVFLVWSCVYTIVMSQTGKSFQTDVANGYMLSGASPAEEHTDTIQNFESAMKTALDAAVGNPDDYSDTVFVASWSNSIENPPPSFTQKTLLKYFTSPDISDETEFPSEYSGNPITSVRVASSTKEIDDSTVCYSPAFETTDTVRTLAFGASVSDAESAVSGVRKKAKAYNAKLAKMLTVSALAGGVLSSAVIAERMEAVDDVLDAVADFRSAVSAIKWYELYTGESVFFYRQYCGSVEPKQIPGLPAVYPLYKSYPARLLVPCSMYRKVKTRRFDIFGRKRTKWVKRNIGVRWVELRFVDTTVFSRYVQNPDDGTTVINVNISGTMNSESAGQGTVTLLSELPDSVSAHSEAEFSFYGIPGVSASAYYGCTVNSSTEIVISDSDYTGPSGSFSCNAVSARVRPLPTQSDGSLSDVTVSYSMPHLPYDSEILDYAYKTYGPLDRSPYAIWDRDLVGAAVNDDGTYRKEGWSAFPSTSKEISAMRAGLDIYGKLAALLAFLRSEFGDSRVQLLCTSRSMDDQNAVSCGGEDSAMLSWHNYGLAARIRILSSDGMTAIKNGDSDYMRLISIAEAFEKAAGSGKLGSPVNAVWCGRLVVGADPFDWEFLPVGVSHKDAPKFREALLSREDPVQALGYVDAGPESDAGKYTGGVTAGGRVYVSPSEKSGYSVRTDIPLKDVREFIDLIRLRMSAYGMTLDGRGDMAEWKVRNPDSFALLLVYYGMTGDVGTVRALLGGEYADAYQPILSMYYESDPVTFVKRYLGDAYSDAVVTVDGTDGGSYIRLSDGRMVTGMRSARSTVGMQTDNIFGQKQAGRGDMEFGQWKGGVFVPETEEAVPVYVTDDPVISGYSSGSASYGDAAYLHSVVASQIKTELEGIRAAFDGLTSPLMFDSLENGPNAGYASMLENEFGLIAAQDLLPYDKLRNTYVQNGINARTAASDGTVLGAGANEEDRDASAESIFEKMVSSAQLTGIRTAKLTREHVTVSAASPGITVEQFASILKTGKVPSAKDIM